MVVGGGGVIVILLCADGVKYFSINEEFEVTVVITHRQYFILLLLLYLFDIYLPVICMMGIPRVYNNVKKSSSL